MSWLMVGMESPIASLNQMHKLSIFDPEKPQKHRTLTSIFVFTICQGIFKTK